MTLQIGQILDGKYRIIRELGSGAMGAVYEGENVRIRRRVAIKVLLSAMARRSDSVQRFEREAQAAGRIGSEHIVEVLDLGTLPDGGFFMVMEFLEGMTLAQHIRSHGRVAPRDIAPTIQQLLTGLEMAHEARVIHRDLKPDNIFLVAEHAGQKNFVKILDFGVSKFNPLNADEGMSMTRTGAVVGTPFYMAPEQAKGSRDVDHRSDLYSVGVILYEAVTGQKPFHAGTFNELIFKIVLETPPPPEQFVPNLDPAFGRIVRRAIAREPSERFQTAAEFRDALYIWLHTGRDGSKDQPLQLPPGDFALDGEGATIMMDGVAPLPSAPPMPPANPLPAPRPPPASRRGGPQQLTAQGQQPNWSGTPAPGTAQAGFASGGPGLLPPMASPVAAGAMEFGAPAMGGYPNEAPLRLPSSSPSMTTAPGGVIAPTVMGHPGEDIWPIAGVPSKGGNKLLWGLIAGATLLVAGAGAAALWLLPGRATPPSSEDDGAAVADNTPTPAEPTAPASSAATAPPSADQDPPSGHVDGDGDGHDNGADDTPANTPPPPPEAVAAAPRPAPVAAPPTPRPPSAPAPAPRPTPRPAPPAPSPKPKPSGGRPIKVDL